MKSAKKSDSKFAVICQENDTPGSANFTTHGIHTIEQDRELKVQEIRPPIVNQRVVYKFQCSLCDAAYTQNRH